MLKQRDFRYDINALRAFAVLIVVFFHFQVPFFSAGFLGVDVFFVISGYLMTSIVCESILANNFSFKQFYIARARRIWPGLIVLCCAVLVLGWFALMTADYKTLASHVRDSLLFVSNLKYLSEAGYFDQASHTKWLLHTWSLSVEWQFYLFYPVVVFLFSKLFVKDTCNPQKLFLLHFLLIFVFFAINVFYASFSVEKAFYSLESRAWEMLLGGSAFFLKNYSLSDRARNTLFNSGLFLLLFSLVFISADDKWPGVLAALPTLGTLLVILANKNNRLAGVKWLQWVGERSYSIYLWHWPLVVLINYYTWGGYSYIVFFIIASLFLGHLSYLYVETPARKRLSVVGFKKNVFTLCAALFVTVIAALVIRKDGIPSRLPEKVLAIESLSSDKNPRQTECLKSSAKCVFGGKEIAALVLGDSHADSIVTAVSAALADERKGVLLRAASGCLFASGAQLIKGRNLGCEDLVANISVEISSEYRGLPVIVANRTAFYLYGEHNKFERTGKRSAKVSFSNLDANNGVALDEMFKLGYLETLCSISKTNPVYVLRTVPEMPYSVPREMAKEYLRGNGFESVRLKVSQYRERNLVVDAVLKEAVEQCSVEILDPESVLCDERYCYGTYQGNSLYVDDDHLSEKGNKRLVRLFQKVFVKE